MTGAGGTAVLVLAALALLLLPDRPRVPALARSVVPPRTRPAGSGRRGALAAAGVAAGGLLAVPGQWWWVLPAAAAAGWWVARAAGRTTPVELAAHRSWLVTHGEVLAACLESGLAMSTALTAAASVASRGSHATVPTATPAGDRGGDPAVVLDAVAAMLALGAGADTAWRAADVDPRLAGLAGAARRSTDGGVALAQAVREHVAALRRDSAAADRRAAGRSAVVITAPLGLCFLPAFLCLGLAPVVLGLFSGLQLF